MAESLRRGSFGGNIQRRGKMDIGDAKWHWIPYFEMTIIASPSIGSLVEGVGR